MDSQLTVNDTIIQNKIHNIRGVQVMLDRDLAELYGVETKVFNQAVKRNIKRFPQSFRFQLTKNEYETLRSQIVTFKSSLNTKYLPYVFTEQGVSMLSAVLKSDIAIEISIKIIETFVNMKKLINSNDFYLQQLRVLEKRQLSYEISSDIKFNHIFKALESAQTDKATNGIFFDNQMYDAYSFISDLLRTAKQNIILIDNYIDDTTLTLFSKIPNIKVTIYTHTLSKQLKLDINKYNAQYNNIVVKTFKDSHDRFLILDNKEVYLIGASLKDLGKKWFGFSKIDISSIDSILKRLGNE